MKTPIPIDPWIGDQCEAGSRFGCRLLVLGVATSVSEGSRLLVGYYREPPVVSSYFTKVSRMLLVDRRAGAGQRAEIWRHVAFDNFLRATIDNVKSEADAADWERGNEAFRETVALTRPQRILAVGKMLERADSAIREHGIPVEYIRHPNGRGGMPGESWYEHAWRGLDRLMGYSRT